LQQLRRTAIGLDEEIRQKFQQLGEARKAQEVVLGQVEQTRSDVEKMTKHRNALADELAGLQVGAAVTKSGAEELGAIAGAHRAEVGRKSTEAELLRNMLANKSSVEEDVSSLQVLAFITCLTFLVMGILGEMSHAHVTIQPLMVAVLFCLSCAAKGG